MASRFTPGDTVQTRLGKGVVREVRNRGRLVVDVQGRALVVSEHELAVVPHGHKRSQASTRSERDAKPTRPKREGRTLFDEIDLHGLTVEEALERVQQALNAALLADAQRIAVHSREERRTSPRSLAPSLARNTQRQTLSVGSTKRRSHHR